MTARWLTGTVLAVDLETTSPNPEEARIVTAHAVECGIAGAVVRGNWLVNPGVPIPAEASAIHGITDEMVRAGGVDPAVAVVNLLGLIAIAQREGVPLVIMNANFDLTVLRAECARVGHNFDHGPILDPRVIDLACDKYRRGKRKLLDLVAHYGVKVGAAHSADGDALMAARIVWRQARRYPLIADKTIDEMQTFQAAAYREWADHLTEYYRSTGKNEVVDPSWPIREANAHTRAA